MTTQYLGTYGSEPPSRSIFIYYEIFICLLRFHGLALSERLGFKMSQLRFRLANLLNEVAQWLVNPRAAIAQWEKEHPYYEECDPFCWCLDCQAEFDYKNQKGGY